MKRVVDFEGRNITQWITDAAGSANIDPIALLALLKAESGLNGHAERVGYATEAFAQHLLWYTRGDRSQADRLQQLIDDAWPDISFGYSQRIVLYHEEGDRTQSLENVLAVRKAVFEGPVDDIHAAAHKLSDAKTRSSDNSYLGALVVYNAGSDRRNDPDWLSRWAGNVAAYQAALDWAEQYRDEVEAPQPTQPELVQHLDELWGLANELEQLGHSDIAGRIRERVVAIKEL